MQLWIDVHAGDDSNPFDHPMSQPDVAVRPNRMAWQLPNHPQGIAQLVAQLQALNVTLVVFKATGGWEYLVSAALLGAGVVTAIVSIAIVARCEDSAPFSVDGCRCVVPSV